MTIQFLYEFGVHDKIEIIIVHLRIERKYCRRNTKKKKMVISRHRVSIDVNARSACNSMRIQEFEWKWDVYSMGWERKKRSRARRRRRIESRTFRVRVKYPAWPVEHRKLTMPCHHQIKFSHSPLSAHFIHGWRNAHTRDANRLEIFYFVCCFALIVCLYGWIWMRDGRDVHHYTLYSYFIFIFHALIARIVRVQAARHSRLVVLHIWRAQGRRQWWGRAYTAIALAYSCMYWHV